MRIIVKSAPESEMLIVVSPLEHSAKMTILVIDSYAGICTLYEALSSNSGHKYLYTNNTNAVLNQIRGQKIDLILTTLSDEGINGMKLAQTMAVSHPSIPIVFLTFDRDRAERILPATLPSNVKGLFLKPSKSNELESIIKQGLKER